MVCVCFACMLLWSLMLARIHFQRCLSFSTPPSLMMISDDSDKAEFNGSYVGDYYPNDNTRLKYFSPLEFHTHSIGEGLCCSYSGIFTNMSTQQSCRKFTNEHRLAWPPYQPKSTQLGYSLYIGALPSQKALHRVLKLTADLLDPHLYWRCRENVCSKGTKIHKLPLPKFSMELLDSHFPSLMKVAVRTYAVRVLPLADYTMINSINPVFVILIKYK